MIIISMIAAVAENGIIGDSGKLPWKLKSDLQYFKMITLNKPVIMGRKTFESIKKPLPDRTNIVVTRDENYKPVEGVVVAHSLGHALDIAKQVAEDDEQTEIIIAGGAEIYKQGMDFADRLYITRVHTNPNGDAKFPDFNKRDDWFEVKSEFHQAGEGESADYTIKVYDKHGYGR